MRIMRSSVNAPKEADVMRGTDIHQSGMFSYVSLESRVPQEHPLRGIKELLDYNLLFRWFVGLSIDEPIWDHSSFTKNRDRLIEARVARKLLRRVVRKARIAHLLSNEHFSVDGTR